MYIIGVDDNSKTISMLEKMLSNIDPEGEHRFYSNPMTVLEDLSMPVEVAFLDIEMSGINGVELAKRIIKRYPLCNIIFLTGHQEYMPMAFDLYASGYILKPFSQKKVEDALNHRRYRLPDFSDRPVKVQCFGNFEAYVNGEAINFKRQKSKELFAYLIDRRGTMCDMDMIIGNIEPEAVPDKSTKSKVRVYVGALVMTFLNLGIDDVIVKQTGGMGINMNKVDCDYYRYLDGDPYAVSRYNGEYMTQYDFAAETRSFLEMKFRKEGRL